MNTKRLLAVLILINVSAYAYGQSNFNYELKLVPVSVTNLPGLHSYAFAQYQGKWLIIGGRKDGIHARQPFNAFPASQNNTDIYVVDVWNNQLWSSSVNDLPPGLREQLQSTNMNFHQEEDTLYIVGGYGFSESSDDHITYPYLTSVNVPDLIEAIQTNQPIDSYFKQIQDNIFAVTGGHLNKLNGLYYLVGGHRFDGRYNPMGHATFTQTYTNQIRKFSIDNSGGQLGYSNFTAITDPVHLRRRDYNLLPQIFPNGEQGFTISSGVFQSNVDLPFLYPVDITETDYTPVTTFNQYLSNYHSAVACLYDSNNNNMHALFFGGMSQYYYEDDKLIRDDLVPFVSTISRLTRDANGDLSEYQLPVEMPALKGASAEFIPNLDLPHYSNDVFKLSEIDQSSFMVGHIFGGIHSPLLNPFSNNETDITKADNTIYEVWLKENAVAVDELEIDGTNPFDVTVFPSPFEKEFLVKFHFNQPATARYFITNNLGQIVSNSENEWFGTGENTIKIAIDQEHNGEFLYLTVIFDDTYYVSKKLVKR